MKINKTTKTLFDDKKTPKDKQSSLKNRHIIYSATKQAFIEINQGIDVKLEEGDKILRFI